MYKVIPEDVRLFILQYIDSIAQMEALLMFCGNPQKEWDAGTIAKGLFITDTQADAILAQLLQRGFIIAVDGNVTSYQYQPKLPEWRELIERMATLYRQYLIPITNLIHSKSKSRIQEFADAFKLRKD